jgi:cyclic beta-1,2-glucan synthetase
MPLMGTGDWNDGMNRVGRAGRGESVWLGFFLFEILGNFVPLLRSRGDAARAVKYAAYRDALLVALNETGWDGEWYRRAYYDDGTPLGTKSASECRIDSLAQSWSVLSGAASPQRAQQAMHEAERQLISEGDGLIRLLTPPFQDTAEDPGYIKGYVAGVRENGGQYTHAACWMVRALAAMGQRDRAARLLAMLSPLSHTRTPADVERYKAEPYVIAADVYGAEPHIGRGGWTWYTGSAGWAYRVAVESVLGLRVVNGDSLVLKPCVPDEWPSYRIDYAPPGMTSRYVIEVTNPRACSEAVVSVMLDGKALPVSGGEARVPICADGAEHLVAVVLGARATR